MPLRFDQRRHCAVAQGFELQLRVDAQELAIAHVHVDQAAHGFDRADLGEHAALCEHRDQAAPLLRLGVGVLAGHGQVVRRFDFAVRAVGLLLVACVVAALLPDLEQQLFQLVVLAALGSGCQAEANRRHVLGGDLERFTSRRVALALVGRAQLAQPRIELFEIRWRRSRHFQAGNGRQFGQRLARLSRGVGVHRSRVRERAERQAAEQEATEQPSRSAHAPAARLSQ